MSLDQYFVVRHQGEWKIKHNGRHSRTFDSQADAIEEAVRRAKDTGGNGKNSQVVVQGENNVFRTEWTYGKDPYPPEG